MYVAEWYVEDETGAFDWIISDQVHEFITELVRPMAYWDAPMDSYSPEQRGFAQVWQKAEKIVFSRTLTTGVTRNTRVERDFDLEAIRNSSGNRSTTSTLAALSLRGLRSKLVSLTNVTCFSTL